MRRMGYIKVIATRLKQLILLGTYNPTRTQKYLRAGCCCSVSGIGQPAD